MTPLSIPIIPCLQLRARRNNEPVQNSDKLSTYTLRRLQSMFKSAKWRQENTYLFQLKFSTENSCRDSPSAHTPIKTDAYNFM